MDWLAWPRWTMEGEYEFQMIGHVDARNTKVRAIRKERRVSCLPCTPMSASKCVTRAKRFHHAGAAVRGEDCIDIGSVSDG